jgi:hypothetical protein
MPAIGVEVGNGGKAVRFGVSSVTHERLVSSRNQGIDDGPADEARSAEDDDSHG